MRYDPECVYFQFTPRTQLAQDMVNSENLMYDVYPKINMADDAERYNDLFGTLSKAFEEFASKYILSSDGVSWESWLEQAKKLGSDEMSGLIRKHAGGQVR